MFQKMSVSILGLVENMSSYVCPKCSHVASIFWLKWCREARTDP